MRRAYRRPVDRRGPREAAGVLPARRGRRAASTRGSRWRSERGPGQPASSCSASNRTRPASRRTPPIASATSSSRRGCRSSSGAASRRRAARRWRARRAAASRRCSNEQVRRMLADPRSRVAGDQLRRPVAAPAQPRLDHARTCGCSPTSTTTCARPSGRRRSCFFESILREDRSVLDLLKGLHVPQRAAREALRHPARLRQPLPPRRRSTTTASAAACCATAAS